MRPAAIYLLLFAVFAQTNSRGADNCANPLGEQRVAALLINHLDGTLPSYITPDRYRQMLFGSGGVSDFFREVSGGRTWLTGEVFTLTVPQHLVCLAGDEGAGLGVFLNQAYAYAAQQLPLQGYTRWIVIFADGNGCNRPEISVANGGGGCPAGAWFKQFVATQEVIQHELGHTFGLGHANVAQFAGEPVGPFGTRDTSLEYANSWDTMGYNRGHFSGPAKASLGWQQVSNTRTVTEAGTFTIKPLELSTHDTQILRVRRGSSSEDWLWIEYRRRLGFDQTDPDPNVNVDSPLNGALLYLENPFHRFESGAGTYLLNFGQTNDALHVGETWLDPYSELGLQILSESDQGLQVRVSYDSCVTVSPAGARHSKAPQTGSISVTTTGTCPSAVVNSSDWITITGGAASGGSRTVTYSLSENQGPWRRKGVVSIGRRSFEITQEGWWGDGPDGVSVTPSQGSSAPGETQRFRFVAREALGGDRLDRFSVLFGITPSGFAACNITYLRADRSLTLYGEFPSNYTQPGPVTGTIGSGQGLSNSRCSVNLQTATATVSGINLELALDITFFESFEGEKTIYLATSSWTGAWSYFAPFGAWTVGSSCTVTAPPIATAFGSEGGTQTVRLTASGPRCPWTIVPGPSNLFYWLSVDKTSGLGSADVTLTAAPTHEPYRSSPLGIAGQFFTLQQNDVACAVSASVSTSSFSTSGGSGRLNITSNYPGCNWTLTGTPPWITLPSASGNGSATVDFQVQANVGAARTASLILGGSALTLTQAAASCSISASASPTSFPVNGGTGLLSLQTSGWCPWSVSSAPAWIDLPVRTGTGPATLAFTVLVNPGAARSASIDLAGASVALSQAAAAGAPPLGSDLRFVPVVPCRVSDTRVASGKTGSFGPPAVAGGTSRTVPIPDSGCGVPASAKAYTLNITVAPAGPLGYITVWPTGHAQPLASTLNSFDGRIVANAAIIPAGAAGAIDVFVTHTTELIIDVTGYFTEQPANLAFFPLAPCRVIDTRPSEGIGGTLGPPRLEAQAERDFPIRQGRCGIPSWAEAYSLNFTVVPAGPLAYLSAWPTGSARPLVSTLNSFDGQIVANAAILLAGAGGSIRVFATGATELIVDVNGYFAPDSLGGLLFSPQVPCRAVDTRPGQPIVGAFGPPSLQPGRARTFSLISSSCAVPVQAGAISMNVTVVPQGGLSYLTLWSSRTSQPLVSTLNSLLGRVLANAAIVPTSGAINAYATDQTDLILDVNGVFR